MFLFVKLESCSLPRRLSESSQKSARPWKKERGHGWRYNCWECATSMSRLYFVSAPTMDKGTAGGEQRFRCVIRTQEERGREELNFVSTST